MRLRRLITSLSLALLAGIMASAQAASPKTGPMGATSSVPNSCTIVAANSLAFGNYSPISGLTGNGTSHFQLRCTKAASYAITSNGGIRHNGTMIAGSTTLSYGLFTDAALTKPIGSGSGTAPALPGTLTSGTTKFCFTNVILNIQNLPANVPYVRYQNTVGGAFTYAYGYVGAITSGTCTAAFGSTAVGVVTYFTNPGVGPNVSVQTTGTSPASNNVFFYPTTLNSYAGTSASGLAVIDIPIYGLVPANQNVQAGTYLDTVTFTLTF